MEAFFIPFIANFNPFWVPITAILCGTVIAVVAILRGKNPPKNKPEEEEESRMIQQLYEQCNRLADRIEALETIILEQEKNRKPPVS